MMFSGGKNGENCPYIHVSSSLRIYFDQNKSRILKYFTNLVNRVRDHQIVINDFNCHGSWHLNGCRTRAHWINNELTA